MYPILFHVGPLPVYSYGVMLTLAFVAGWVLLMFRTQAVDRGWASRVFLLAGAAALLGARLLYVAVNWSRYLSVNEAFSLRSGGGVAYGGFIVGFLAAWLLTRNRHQAVESNLWIVAATPALLLGLAITRVGCFLNGCDFGKPSTVAWAVRFPSKSPAFSWQRFSGLLGPEATRSLPVHPTQLYEVVLGLALLLLWYAAPERSVQQLGRFRLVVVGYAVGRFFLEILRDEPGRGSWAGFSTSQWLALLTILGALYAPMLSALRAKSASV